MFGGNFISQEKFSKYYDKNIIDVRAFSIMKDCFFKYKYKNNYKCKSVSILSINGEKVNKKIAIILGDFVALGTTYLSADGEYRPCFTKISDYLDAVKNDPRAKVVIDYIKKDEYEFSPSKYSPYYFYLWQFMALTLFGIVDPQSTFKIKDFIQINYDDISLSQFEFACLFYHISYFISSEITEENLMFPPYRSGIKFIPLTINSLQEPFNIKFHEWKELYIGILVNKLIANAVTIGLPLLHHWIFIESNYKNLYDNSVTFEKYNLSSNIIKFENDLANLMKKHEITSFEIPEVDNLRVTIDDVIDEIKDTAHYSNTSLGILTNYLGMSFNSFKTHFDAQHKNVFIDIAYNLACLNKIGIIHNDLHHNNLCVNGNFFNILYKVGFDVYKTSDFHYNINIIDFSRSLMSSESVEKYSLRYKDIHDQILAEQRSKIHATYKLFFPNFWDENKELIKGKLISDYDGFFELYKAYDLYRFSLIWLEDLNEYEEIYDLCFKINSICKEYLTDYVEMLLYNNLGEVQNPNIKVLELFKGEVGEVEGVYDLNTKLIYDTDDYKHLHELAQVYDFKPGDKLILEEYIEREKKYNKFPLKSLTDGYLL